jgi:hypothetical protein
MSSKISANLFCAIGDVVEANETIHTSPHEESSSLIVHEGNKYVATSLIGWGWDLELIQGEVLSSSEF